MQLSGLHRRHPVPTFINHTPKEFEITPLSPSQSPEMFGPTGIAVAAGPLYTNAIMGQAPSAVERENIRKASSTIFREDSILVEEESIDVSRPDSFSIHCDYTDQAPYSTDRDDEMMTSTSHLRLPKDNASHDLAFFLRTTGPSAPHRRPSKIDHPKRAVAVPKNAFKFFRRQKRSDTWTGSQDKFSGVLHDEGGLLNKMPEGVEQRETSYGQRYLALQVQVPSPLLEEDIVPPTSESGHDILESRVSISFAEDLNGSETLDIDNWLVTLSKGHSQRNSLAAPRKSSTHLPLGDGTTVRVVNYSSSPIRPAASNPPTPRPESAVSMAESYRSDIHDHPVKRSYEACRALSSHPVQASSPITALPKISLPNEEFPVKHPSPEKEVEIKHPSPRRFASHPVLSQRASTLASSLHPRSFSDSPGPPPPRSPLRLRRDPRTIESIIASHNSTRKPTPKLAPIIKPVSGYNEEVMPIKPTVITECTGPIKRPKSCSKNPVSHLAYPAFRKEREERIRQRRLRDRPYSARTIDTVVLNATPPLPRQRLRKARPQIQIPELKPALLITRASSSASSNASWKKIIELTRTPVSPVPSQDSPASNGEKTGYTPISLSTLNASASAGTRMALSPVMLFAEEIPVPKTKSTPKPAKLIIKEGKTYAPRPRSASVPRNALKRRSRTSLQTSAMQTPPRSISPAGQRMKEDSPPLPSPPPNRALPPTPPTSGPEKAGKARSTKGKKELPVPPVYEIIPKNSSPPKRSEHVPHVATQAQRKSTGSGESDKTAKIYARLEAVEKQNALLSAALMAVLRTNGTLNNAMPAITQAESPKPMSWENRIARHSAASQAASHAASSSNGSALEMYMSTRRGSKHGRNDGGSRLYR